MSFTPADVRKLILTEDDFGHEMRVGNVFASVAARTPKEIESSIGIEMPQHGGTYTDSVTGKLRQFDFRCRVRFQDMSPGDARCAILAVECKNLHQSSPLLVCGRPRTSDEAYHAFICSQYDKKISRLSVQTKKTLPMSYLYPAGSFVGKSLLRLKEKGGKVVTDSQADIYDGWSQALASSVELAEAACFSASRDSMRQYLCFVQPVVVVPNETLWMAVYDRDGSIPNDPTMVRECEYFVEKRFDVGPTGQRWAFALTHIHFVTIGGFADLLSRFLQPPTWESIFPEHAPNMLA